MDIKKKIRNKDGDKWREKGWLKRGEEEGEERG